MKVIKLRSSKGQDSASNPGEFASFGWNKRFAGLPLDPGDVPLSTQGGVQPGNTFLVQLFVFLVSLVVCVLAVFCCSIQPKSPDYVSSIAICLRLLPLCPMQRWYWSLPPGPSSRKDRSSGKCRLCPPRTPTLPSKENFYSEFCITRKSRIVNFRLKMNLFFFCKIFH